MKKVFALIVVLVIALSFAACKKEKLGGKNITIQKWLDSKGGSDDNTLMVTIKDIENPLWAVVEDSSGATVHLYGVIINGELESFEDAGLSAGDTIVISSGKYNEFEGTVEIKEATLIEIKEQAAEGETQRN